MNRMFSVKAERQLLLMSASPRADNAGQIYMHKRLVCDGKRYLTPLAPESQSNTFNYQWLCLVVDIKMSASRSITSGSLPLVMSLAVHSFFPSTHICPGLKEHLS